MRSFLIGSLLLCGMLSPACRCDDDRLNERTPPTLEHAPAALDFGDVPVGLRATRAVRVTNRGELDLDVSNVTTQGSPAFSSTAVPFTLGTFVEGRVEAAFAPTASGPVTGTLVITSNASNGSPTIIPLTGNGVGATVCGPCNSPPATVCLSPTELLVYEPVGTCANNECRYAARTVTCPVECVVNQCVPPLDAGFPSPVDAGPTDAGLPDAATPPADAGNPFTGPCGPPIIVPYVEGGSFGGFQSVPGSGYQQTIRITFNCVVDSVTVTIADPDFPENVMNAFYQGALVGSATFIGDGTPAAFTEDTQSITAAAIDEVLLIPDPLDYVAYRLVQYSTP